MLVDGKISSRNDNNVATKKFSCYRIHHSRTRRFCYRLFHKKKNQQFKMLYRYFVYKTANLEMTKFRFNLFELNRCIIQNNLSISIIDYILYIDRESNASTNMVAIGGAFFVERRKTKSYPHSLLTQIFTVHHVNDNHTLSSELLPTHSFVRKKNGTTQTNNSFQNKRINIEVRFAFS